MANSNTTKVNTQQVRDLVTKLNSVSNSVNSDINSYRKNLSTIESSGYLMGVAEFAINLSLDKVTRTCAEFKEYSQKLATELNKVVAETEKIETEEKGNIEEIINSDPTKFSGSSSNSVLSNSPMANIIARMKENMAAITKSTGSYITTKDAATTVGAAAAVGTATLVKTTGVADKVKQAVAKVTEADKKTSSSNTSSAKSTTTTSSEKKSTTKTTATSNSSKSGTSKEIPSGNTSFKSYTNINALARNTPQSAVARGGEAVPYGKYKGTVYNTKTDPATGVRYVTFDGSDEKYYCAAMGTYYGEVGDTLNIQTDDGNNFNVILTDVKGSDAVQYGNGLSYYHSKGSNKDLVEFYIEYPADDIRVPGGTTGNYNDCSAFSGNITSVKKLS